MNNPLVQETAFERYTNMNERRLKQMGLISDKSSEAERYAALAGAHLGGPGGVRNLLKKGKNTKDAYGTGVRDYYGMMYGVFS